nr:immunoglobulin heavy chain junction region [Mus musculus]
CARRDDYDNAMDYW